MFLALAAGMAAGSAACDRGSHIGQGNPRITGVAIERSVVVEPGVSVAYVYERARTAPGGRPCIVLVTGEGAHDRSYPAPMGDTLLSAYDFLARVLHSHGYGVLRVDERGTGRSTGSYANTATTTRLAADLRAVLRDFQSFDPDTSRFFVLVGHGEGAVIAAMVARELDARSGTVFLGAPARPGEVLVRQRQPHQVRDARQWSRSASMADRQQALAREHARRAEGDVWYREFLTLDPMPHYAGVQGPMLLLHGASDWQVSPDQAEAIAAQQRRRGARDVTVTVLDGVDHFFRRDRNDLPIATPVVWDAVLGWLGARWPGVSRRGSRAGAPATATPPAPSASTP